MDANGSRIHSTGLTNDDFRKFLATSQSHAGLNERKKHKNRNKGELEHRHGKFGPESVGHEEKDGSAKQGYVYRDRAEERRRGMVGIEGEDDLHASHSTDRDLSAVSLEESKYLGGDLEHTHLVKGLDYALLSQARAEREKKKLGLVEGEKVIKEENLALQQTFTRDEHTDRGLAGLARGKIGQAVITALKHLVHVGENNQNISKKITMKRTGFVYNMKDQDSKFEIPIMRMRAEEDCPTETDGAQNCGLPPHIVQEIARIIEYTMGPLKNIPRRKSIEQTAASGLIAHDHGVLHQPDKSNQTKPADEDDDIFADAGTDYVPERKAKSEGKMDEPKSGKGARYFDVEDRVHHNRSSEISQGIRVLGIDLGNVAAAKDDLSKLKEEEERRRRLASLHAGENDGYEECYPGFVGSAGMLEDSDDGEGDLEPDKDDNGVRKKRQNVQENVKEAKLESQLHNIQKIFEEKGYEHTTAFAKSEIATTKSGIRGNLQSRDLTQATKKKRRI